MCDAPATSQEHAPPACLFPEQSSIGRDLRKNLITVPSCDLHNSKKSEDDEFLRATICLSAAGISPAATHNFQGNVLRGASRSPAKYSAFAPRANVLTPPEKSAFKTDRSRFDRCVEHIAKAICFHTYDIKWQQPIVVVSPQLQIAAKSGQLAAHTPSLGAIAATRDFLTSEPVKCENAEIFLYRIKIHEGTLGFAALFYEYFEIFAASSPGIPGHGA
jgi:hypothetical protein